jgi:hypothetical protein
MPWGAPVEPSSRELLKSRYRKALYDHIEARENLDFTVGTEISDAIRNAGR